jgi:hypothetical protein
MHISSNEPHILRKPLDLASFTCSGFARREHLNFCGAAVVENPALAAVSLTPRFSAVYEGMGGANRLSGLPEAPKPLKRLRCLAPLNTALKRGVNETCQQNA